ncbi:septal ring lytic transglycosylase RlpA family protein [bacterium]|nr:septal ring lytic transglycosylase RlpA family protein [bacterium]
MRKKCAMLMMLCFILAACGTTTRRVTVEPGPSWMRPWQRPYTVDGERYVPLLDAVGFREEGLASWYGAEEHGGPTSNGEVFDMYKPTAAHKTLPLGCFIRVTNKANGKSTVVRVNDRGPFIPGRIVDLSYRAAQDLDFVGHGVTPVMVEVMPAGSENVGRSTAPEGGAVYTLQVAAYSDRETARLVAEKLGRELSFSAVREVETERGHFYRVHAGRFRSRSDAEAARSTMARNGFPDAFIVDQ